MRWIMATLMNASLLAVVRSYSFDSRRERLSHPNVRSTIHRFLWGTNPFCPTSFLATTPAHPHHTQACRRAGSKWESPQTTLTRLTAARSFWIRGMPPARSWTDAGVTITAHSSPRVSTATNRFRPTTFFPRVSPTRAAHLRRLHRLAVHDGRRRLRLPAGGPADVRPEPVVNLVPGAVLLPGPEVVEDDPVRRQVVGQGPPHAP